MHYSKLITGFVMVRLELTKLKSAINFCKVVNLLFASSQTTEAIWQKAETLRISENGKLTEKREIPKIGLFYSNRANLNVSQYHFGYEKFSSFCRERSSTQKHEQPPPTTDCLLPQAVVISRDNRRHGSYMQSGPVFRNQINTCARLQEYVKLHTAYPVHMGNYVKL